jgi:formylmethanofuran dehydrogenase subunit E
MSETKTILRTLLSDHQGEHNSITQAQLSEATGINTSTLRSEISRLREERNIPIANKRNGYYIINSKAELEDFVAHKNQEIESKRKTIEDTLEAFNSFDPESIKVEPESNTVEQTYECFNCEDTMPESEKRYAEGHDEPCCKSCYGGFLMNGQSFKGV